MNIAQIYLADLTNGIGISEIIFRVAIPSRPRYFHIQAPAFNIAFQIQTRNREIGATIFPSLNKSRRTGQRDCAAADLHFWSCWRILEKKWRKDVVGDMPMIRFLKDLDRGGWKNPLPDQWYQAKVLLISVDGIRPAEGNGRINTWTKDMNVLIGRKSSFMILLAPDNALFNIPVPLYHDTRC